jgi:hypothetical protein
MSPRSETLELYVNRPEGTNATHAGQSNALESKNDIVSARMEQLRTLNVPERKCV